MNSYTNKNDFLEEPGFILDNCELLIRENCVILNNVLYERVENRAQKYRFFFSCDDYDYLEDYELECALEELQK